MTPQNKAKPSQVKDLNQLYGRYFPDPGYFVDVGAYDGATFSNTNMLADSGWRGLCIEPVYHQKCRKYYQGHKNIIVDDCAVGPTDGMVDVFVGDTLSTTSTEMVERFKRMAWSAGLHKGEKRRVIQKTLDHVLTEHGVPIGFELLDIDIEGSEWQVLKDFSLEKWLPKMVIIEIVDDNPNYNLSDVKNLIDYFDKRYRIIWKDVINTIYILK